MNTRRLTTTALVVASAALVSAGAFVGVSLSDDDDDGRATPIAVAAQATTAPEPVTRAATPIRQRDQQARGAQRDSRGTTTSSQSSGQTTITQPTSGIAIVGGDADVFGDQVRLEAETTQTVSSVEFTYGGLRYTGELTETDAEDATKEWGVTVPSLAADRTPGETLEFRVQACDTQTRCADATITELVEFDD